MPLFTVFICSIRFLFETVSNILSKLSVTYMHIQNGLINYM